MAEQKVQTKENHVRLHPIFHFFFVPAVGVLLAMAAYGVVRAPGLVSAEQLLLILLVGIAGFLARNYSIKVQSRVIRLEERLRLATLVPNHLLSSTHGLTERQLIALRFASDEELPALAVRAGSQNMEPAIIKAAILNWRPDHWRV